jgi:hypothetical protein
MNYPIEFSYIPKGWIPIAFRKALPNEHFLDTIFGGVEKARFGTHSSVIILVEERV